jgi:hypothetical protein
MASREGPAAKRQFRTEQLQADLVVVGGGMAGTCCAITAARAGVKVVLVQDRPVLGGNASSEVRLWILGATAHMGNNNRWSREGGVIEEILVENLWRNPEGNPCIVDALLLEKATQEKDLKLLLNTACLDCAKSDPDTLASVRAFCAQNSTMYEIAAPLFCDASGDGVLGFLSGAAFRMGAESADEFGESIAPGKDYGELLGHSLYFYSRDVGVPVRFIAPSFALTDITKIPRFHQFDARTYGCRLWWIEWGGRLDTIHDTETIKWELWKIAYGVWNYIKNSGKFPQSDTLTLEWVGMIPGKRESRRFEGDYILTQQDVLQQRIHRDAVAFGGWSIDLHPADGVYSPNKGSNHWHPRGIYQIPLRCLHSRNIRNLFLAGRIVSVSHVAFGSTRVMATGAHMGQAAGMAAAVCRRRSLLPSQLGERVREVQDELGRTGQFIPRIPSFDRAAREATLAASSRLLLGELRPDGPWLNLARSWAQMLPVRAGAMPRVTLTLSAAAPTQLNVELRQGKRLDDHAPTTLLASHTLPLSAGEQRIELAFDATLDAPRYVWLCLRANEAVSVRTSQQRVTGVLAVRHAWTQTASAQGVEAIEFWQPERRPAGHNFAMVVEPALDVFGPENVANGFARPTSGPNAWVAQWSDPRPALTLTWNAPRTIRRIELRFDTDFDHPMESVLMGHPERAMPFCVRRYRLLDGGGRILHECQENHHSRNVIALAEPVTTDRLVVELLETWGGPDVPPALFEVRCDD